MPSLTHIALHVRDLEACLAFYRDFCGLHVTHERGEGSNKVVWMAEQGHEDEFVFVFLAGGPGRDQGGGEYSHLGFACPSREHVDEVARRAKEAGCLEWPVVEEPYPVGYYCGLKDPDGNFVEFSYGQPLGPGAPPRPGV
jgi:catechol 2,3-dioxygenase-like lactoylglutathione lyase family enzyme